MGSSDCAKSDCAKKEKRILNEFDMTFTINYAPFLERIELPMLLGVADYTTFVISIIVLLALPGPGNLALITATGKGGVRAGVAATFGVILGDQILLWTAVVGLSALLKTMPNLFLMVQVLGAAYLMWLGWQLVRVNKNALPVITMKMGAYCRQTLVITLLNPKAIMFYMAFFPLFISPSHHQGLITFSFMAMTIATLTLIYGVCVTLLTKYLSRALTRNPKVRQWLERLAGLLLIAFGIQLLLGRI